MGKLTRGCRQKKALKSFEISTLAVIIAGVILFPSPSLLSEDVHQQSKEKKEHTAHTPPPIKMQQESSSYSHEEILKKLEQVEKKPESDQTLHLPPEMLKLSDIRTAPVEYRRLVREIQTVGEITYDERRMKIVSAWVGGRIDRLYVDFTGVRVRKGDPLAKLYSPDLVSTQQELILALETRGRLWSRGNQDALQSSTDLVEATKQRLLLWGISQGQIDEIERTRQVKTHMTIHAPIGGTVIHKQAYEGQYVKMGEKLYTIVDLFVVWALADIYEYEMAWVKAGQKVTITTPAYPEREFTGTVSFIDPFLDTKTRSVKVRMDVPNSRLMLKPGMFAEARLNIPFKDQKPVLSVPYTAILDTGVRKLAYVDQGSGNFRPVEVRVGLRAGDWIPVLRGLKKGMQVAVSANYLIDSQRALGAGGATGHSGH